MTRRDCLREVIAFIKKEFNVKSKSTSKLNSIVECKENLIEIINTLINSKGDLKVANNIKKLEDENKKLIENQKKLKKIIVINNAVALFLIVGALCF